MTHECAFGDLFAHPLRNGLFRPRSTRGVGTKMVNMGELFAHERIRDLPMDRVPLSQSERTDYLLCPGDLLFARQSLVFSGAGKCVLFIGDREPVTFESHIIRARLNRAIADPGFYFYYFKSPAGRCRVESIVDQVAAAGIRGSDLSRLPVPLPPLSEQRRIADILGSLDDKIELNRRMNRTVEDLARAVFKAWFVDFLPVKAKRDGAKSFPSVDADTFAFFPDSFEECELGETPKGWSAKAIGTLALNVRRQADPSRLDPEAPYVGLEHLPRRSLVLGNWGEARDVTSHKYAFSAGNVLFGKLRPYFHKVVVAPVGGVCSTDILVVRPTDKEWLCFVAYVLSSDEMVAHATAASGGTRMPRASWEDLASYKVAVPPAVIGTAFNAFVGQALELLRANVIESRSLAAARDMLLPRLVLGPAPQDREPVE